MKKWKKIEPFIMIFFGLIGIICMMLITPLFHTDHTILGVLSYVGAVIFNWLFFSWMVTPVHQCSLPNFIKEKIHLHC